MPMSQNAYAILNVSPDADPVVIEAAYKALMKKYHPDRLEGGEASIAKAAMINEAFTTLKDPRKRAEHQRRHMPPERVFVPPEARAPIADPRLKVAAWSGWVAALAFGVALAITVSAREQQFAVAQPQQIAAAAAQEEAAPEPQVPPDPLFEAEPAMAAAAAPIAAAPAVAATVRKRAAAAAPAKANYARFEKKRKEPPRRRAPARAARPQERDFLEREGYIY